ncbi:MAG: hypothetical protein RL268_898 [Pseudomonadota bacterium]
MLHGASLAREPTTLDGGNHVVLAGAVGNLERLVDHEAQGRTGEVDFLVTAIDSNLACAGLDPHAGHGVLAATGGIGAALGVHFLFAQRRGGSGSSRGFGNGAESGEIGDGFFRHYAPTLFLRFMAATSSGCGWVPPCGCSVPA